MGKLEFFDIAFANEHGVFNAGQILAGKVVIVLNEPKKLESISIQFKGFAKTHWTRHQGKSSTHYSSQEQYFNTTFSPDYLHSFADGRLGAGRHEVPFSFQLPKNLPSSFEGPHGHIRYVCVASLVRTWKWNITCKTAFTVIACEDLNLLPEASIPVEVEESSMVACCCLPQGMVSLTLRMPKQGFVPGEAIQLNCAIVNNSRSRIDKVCARLKQYVVYKGESFWGFGDTKTTSTEVARLEKTKLLYPGETMYLNDEALLIPSLPPRLVGCSIIDVSYMLKFEVGSYANCTIPIILGTVPIYSRAQAAFPCHVTNNSTFAALNDAPPPYCETPPPSYRECIMGSYCIEEEGDGQHVLGDRFFVPRYVYYGML